MNLADIRKKALEKSVSQPEAPLAEPAPAQPAVVPEEAEVVPRRAEPASAPLVEARSSSEVTAAAALPNLPDPVALILAGREQAGCGEDLTLSAAEAEAQDGESQEFLCFRVAAELYAVNIMEIKEIIKPREVTEVPRTPSFVSGVLSLRGIIIPVIDMRQRLGFPGGEELPKSRIIVVKKGAEYCGLFVDEVVQVVRIATHSIEQPPAVLEGIDREFVHGIGRYDGRMLILLTMEKILDITLN